VTIPGTSAISVQPAACKLSRLFRRKPRQLREQSNQYQNIGDKIIVPSGENMILENSWALQPGQRDGYAASAHWQ